MLPSSSSPKTNKKKTIIFDFDGVLADSFECFYALIRDGMGGIGLSLTARQYRDMFIGNVHLSFKRFIDNEEKYKVFSEFRKKNYGRFYCDKNRGVKLFPGAVRLIRRLAKTYNLSIASSGRQSSIANLLKKNRVKPIFNPIVASSAETKEKMMIKILARHKAQPKNSVMISDTVGDIKVARKLGLKTVAVTWGFHSKKLLTSAKPDKICSEIRKLPLAIDALFW